MERKCPIQQQLPLRIFWTRFVRTAIALLAIIRWVIRTWSPRLSVRSSRCKNATECSYFVGFSYWASTHLHPNPSRCYFHSYMPWLATGFFLFDYHLPVRLSLLCTAQIWLENIAEFSLARWELPKCKPRNTLLQQICFSITTSTPRRCVILNNNKFHLSYSEKIWLTLIGKNCCKFIYPFCRATLDVIWIIAWNPYVMAANWSEKVFASEFWLVFCHRI